VPPGAGLTPALPRMLKALASSVVVQASTAEALFR
jgi:hypothetical protein